MTETRDDGHAVLTAKEVASTLRISLSKVYAMARSGELPRVYLGRSVRFPARAIEALTGQGSEVNPSPTRARIKPPPVPTEPRYRRRPTTTDDPLRAKWDAMFQ